MIPPDLKEKEKPHLSEECPVTGRNHKTTGVPGVYRKGSPLVKTRLYQLPTKHPHQATRPEDHHVQVRGGEQVEEI